MKFLNALEQSKAHIRSLWMVLGLMVLMDALAIFGWMHTQSRIRIEIPPRIPESGLTLTQGDIPETTLYSFAFYIWQTLNHWPENGLLDFKQKITQNAPYLTPDFKETLIQNYNQALAQGELQDRIRILQPIASYSPKNVRYLGHGTWLIHLQMHLIERLHSNTKVVKDVLMDYTLKVMRYNVDAKQNPWGLALAGFAKSPKRLKTII